MARHRLLESLGWPLATRWRGLRSPDMGLLWITVGCLVKDVRVVWDTLKYIASFGSICVCMYIVYLCVCVYVCVCVSERARPLL